jgi:hypothetical protein
MVQWNRSRVAVIVIIAALLASAGGFADLADFGSWGW